MLAVGDTAVAKLIARREQPAHPFASLGIQGKHTRGGFGIDSRWFYVRLFERSLQLHHTRGVGEIFSWRQRIVTQSSQQRIPFLLQLCRAHSGAIRSALTSNLPN